MDASSAVLLEHSVASSTSVDDDNESEPSGPLRVLVIDETSSVRGSTASVLRALGHSVVPLEDGRRATDLLEHEVFDVVLMDMAIADPNGLEVCRRIRQSPKGMLTPVVLLTARGAPENTIAGFEAGADECLTKPLRNSVLDIRLRALRRFQTRQRRATVSTKALSLPDLVSARVNELAQRGGLSRRERQVLDLLLIGRTVEDIGTVLGISARTVKFHQANMLEKLGADSRLDLLRLIL